MNRNKSPGISDLEDDFMVFYENDFTHIRQWEVSDLRLLWDLVRKKIMNKLHIIIIFNIWNP